MKYFSLESVVCNLFCLEGYLGIANWLELFSILIEDGDIEIVLIFYFSITGYLVDSFLY